MLDRQHLAILREIDRLGSLTSAAERLNLLETLAEKVAERLLAEPAAMRVFVRIEKLDVGPYALGVEIVRSRAEVPVRVAHRSGALWVLNSAGLARIGMAVAAKQGARAASRAQARISA